MKKKFIIVVLAIITISLAGCGSNNSNTKSTNEKSVKQETSLKDKTNDDIIKVIKNKTKAVNDGNINNYLSNFVKDTDTYNTEKADKNQYFYNFKVNQEVSDPQILNSSDKEAQVQYVVTTTKIKGPGFLDSKALYINHLKKVGNDWKIDTQDILKVEFKDDIYNTVYDNIQSLNQKDINKYMSTIDPSDSDAYNKFKDNQLDTFDKYDLYYNLEEADKYKDGSDKDTAVGFVETIVKRDNSDFKNNKTTGVMHLKKVNNQWKIFKIDIQKTEDLK